MNDDLVEDFLHELEGWERAYPLSMFPEPDLAKAAKLLKAGGMTLDAISASNMRHVVSQIAPKARAAISAVECEGWQPIDSAPKDGTMVLLAIEPIEEGYLLGWNPERTITVVIGWWGYSEWTSHLMEEGTADTEGHSSPYQITVRPTHWRPLPQPPVSKGEKM